MIGVMEVEVEVKDEWDEVDGNGTAVRHSRSKIASRSGVLARATLAANQRGRAARVASLKSVQNEPFMAL